MSFLLLQAFVGIVFVITVTLYDFVNVFEGWGRGIVYYNYFANLLFFSSYFGMDKIEKNPREIIAPEVQKVTVCFHILTIICNRY